MIVLFFCIKKLLYFYVPYKFIELPPLLRNVFVTDLHNQSSVFHLTLANLKPKLNVTHIKALVSCSRIVQCLHADISHISTTNSLI